MEAKQNELDNETMKPIQVRKLDFGIDDVQTQFDHDCKDVVKTKVIYLILSYLVVD